ncbi:hypothetical protein HDU93_009401 [Gonapodya sp. JEL0774]|nr:hypothetical protein HDU93_009401 [Gonapodya sp. JEL0774]
MSIAREITLIEAVESGNLEQVWSCLQEGANPNARKKVTVRIGRKAHLAIGTLRRTFSGGPFPKSDASTKSFDAEGESALAIAIRDQRLEIARALLDKGADSNIPIEWKIARTAQWDKVSVEAIDENAVWNQDGEPFPSALSFACAEGIKFFNRPGAEVRLDNPSDLKAVCLQFNLTPRPDIVELLISKGAKISAADLRTAAELKTAPSQAIKDLLEKYLRKSPSDLLLELEELSKENEQLRMRMAELEKELGNQNEQHETRIATLERNSENANEELKKRVAEMEKGLQASTWPWVPFARALSSSTPGATETRKMMVCSSPHKPSQIDEIGLSGGHRVWVVVTFGDGWANGFNTTTGELGFFPLACVSDVAEGAARFLDIPPKIHSRNSSVRYLDTLPAPGTAADKIPKQFGPSPKVPELPTIPTITLTEAINAEGDSEEASKTASVKKPIAEAVKALQQGETRLDLNDLQLDSVDAQALAEAIRGNNTLKELYIHSSKCAELWGQDISRLFKNYLHLSDNNIHEGGVKAVVDALKSGTTVLVEINLRENPIGDDGAKEIARLVKFNDNLEILRLAACKIGPLGVEQIAEALKFNTKLKHLALYSNPIGDQGATYLASALSINVTLNHLRLYEAEIGDAGAKAIADGLGGNEGLNYLNLMKNNAITTDGVQALVASLRKNKTLKELYVKGARGMTILHGDEFAPTSFDRSQTFTDNSNLATSETR